MKRSEETRELRILEELEKNPASSQRMLSRQFNIALGLTNSCIRKMVKRGWIQVDGSDRRKPGYYLTPKGHLEKSRLMLKMIADTLVRYSELKQRISQKLRQFDREGKQRIVFYGLGEAMEIAYAALQEIGLNLVGIVEDDEKLNSKFLFGHEVESVSRINELNPDVVLITSIDGIDRKKAKLSSLLGSKDAHIQDLRLP